MTLNEIQKELENGKRIQISGWGADCFIEIKHGNLVNQDGKNATYTLGTYALSDKWVVYEEPILSKLERIWLEKIIMLVDKNVEYISRIKAEDCFDDTGFEYICIAFVKGDNYSQTYIKFPIPPKAEMFSTMEIGKKYKMEDLGL